MDLQTDEKLVLRVSSTKGTDRTYIFADNLFQSLLKYVPFKCLHILFDDSRSGIGKSHDKLKEAIALGLAFRYGAWFEAFEVATNAILLFSSKAYTNQRLQKRNGIDTGDVIRVAFFPIDAADAAFIPLMWQSWLVCADGFVVGVDGSPILFPPKSDYPSLQSTLFLRPIALHRFQITAHLKHSSIRV